MKKEMKLSKEEKREKKREERRCVKIGLKYIFAAKWMLLIFLALNLLKAGANFLVPLLEAKVLAAFTDFNASNAVKYAVLLLVFGMSASLLYIISMLLWKKCIEIKVSQNIEKDLISAMFDFKVRNFEEKQTGSFQTRIDSDSIDMIHNIDGIQYYFFRSLINVGAIFYCFYLNYILGIILLIGVLITGFAQIYLEVKIDVLRQENKKAQERVNSAIAEAVRGIRDIKILNAKENARNILFRKVSYRNQKGLKFKAIRNASFTSIDISHSIVAFIILIVGIKFITEGKLTVESLLTIYLYKSQAFSSVTQFTYLIQTYNDFTLSAKRAFAFFDDKKAPKEKFGTKHIDKIEGKIKFDNVTFAYNEDRTVLKNMSFEIMPNSKVAFVGESGCGKTTTLAVLTKTYDLEEGKGKIYIDDIDINELDESSLRKAISIITQTPYIFNMSIKDNLLLVKPEATDEELENVCKKAMLFDYVDSLPNKFDTILGEGGLNLSGGQRQRLAIARALLKECKIMLFDEATSALDNVTQKEIQESIDALSNEYTIIIVAHRLSTIKDSDKIFMIEDGKVTHSGTHDELMNYEGYNKLYLEEDEI